MGSAPKITGHTNMRLLYMHLQKPSRMYTQIRTREINSAAFFTPEPQQTCRRQSKQQAATSRKKKLYG